MATIIVSFRNTLLMFIFLTASCFATNSKPEIALIGSTPGDTEIKSMLSISANINIDFIRWNLKLVGKNDFVLDIAYGVSQPNTLDFKDGGRKKTIKGTYTINENQQQSHFKEIYQLKSDDLSAKISLVKLNENLFHVLTSQNQLMVGNGGWSYSLSREAPINQNKILISSPISNSKSLQMVFDGRTPCQEIAAEHPEINASSSCFKLKWKLVLNLDSVTYLPTTCIVRGVVDNQPRDVLGTWSIHKGTATNPTVIIYKIKLAKYTKPILLLVGDENVLFFLDKNSMPFIGNRDFSFALNRK